MAEVWAVGAATVAAGLYESNQQKGAAKAAGNASERAAQAAIDQTNANYDRTKTDLNPYITEGTQALGRIDAANNGDYSGFENSPGYKFALDQGVQASDRSAAAKGSLYSGGHSADLDALGQGLASQNYNTWFGQQTGLAGMGQSAATSLGSIGTGSAAQAGNFGLAGAAAQGNAAINVANANTNLSDTLSQMLGQYMKKPANTTSWGDTSGNVLTGGTYNGTGSLSTSWPGSDGSSWGQYAAI
jgi:hypothetical protein